jgi:hypothetical protein
MAERQLQVLSIRIDDIEGGEAPLSGLRRGRQGLGPAMSGKYYLDPWRVMAALSLITGEHELRIRQLQRDYDDRPEAEFVQAVSEYLLETLGVERIEVRYQLIKAGEYPWPLPLVES